MSTTIALPLAGAVLRADLAGALFWPEEATMIVADLHLEKGSSFARRGIPQFVPPYDTRATIDRLEAMLRQHRPRRVICLGDSVHDGGAAERMDGEDARRIGAMTASCDWIWIAGNHDPAPPAGWGGDVLREVAIGDVILRHQALAGASDTGAYEISGHFHPTAAVATRAARVSGRCFASDGRRLLLPAFGAYAGGLNVLDPAIAGLFDPAFTVILLGKRRMFAFPNARLIA
jgi:DNA ligase-associated metallophosphoesterase